MNKMEQILSASGDSLLKRRSKNVAALIEMEQQTLVNNLKRDVLTLEGQLANIFDLSVKTRDSLSPINENFSALDYARRIQELKIQLRNKRIEYKLAATTYDDLFVKDAKDVEDLSNTGVNDPEVEEETN